MTNDEQRTRVDLLTLKTMALSHPTHKKAVFVFEIDVYEDEPVLQMVLNYLTLDEILDDLAQNPQLETVVIEYSGITTQYDYECLARALGELPHLRELIVSQAAEYAAWKKPAKGAWPAFWSELADSEAFGLKKLQLDGVALQQGMSEPLRSILSTVEELTLQNVNATYRCPRAAMDDMRRMFGEARALEKVHLTSCDAVVVKGLEGCPAATQWHTLRMNQPDLSPLVVDALQLVLRRPAGRHLRALSIDCRTAKGAKLESLMGVFEKMPRLQKLEVDLPIDSLLPPPVLMSLSRYLRQTKVLRLLLFSPHTRHGATDRSWWNELAQAMRDNTSVIHGAIYSSDQQWWMQIEMYLQRNRVRGIFGADETTETGHAGARRSLYPRALASLSTHPSSLFAVLRKELGVLLRPMDCGKRARVV